jgi:hypothetical protein
LLAVSNPSRRPSFKPGRFLHFGRVVGRALAAAFRLFCVLGAAYFAEMGDRWLQIARYVIGAALAVVAALRLATFLHQTCGMRRIELRTDALVLAGLLAFALVAKFLTQRRSRGGK